MPRQQIVTASAVVILLASLLSGCDEEAVTDSEADASAVASHAPSPSPPAAEANSRGSAPLPTVDSPYVYPSLTASQRADPQTAMRSLQVPDEDIDAMTTIALVKTVLNHPYVANLLAFSTAHDAVRAMRSECNALDALLRRSDWADQVRAVQDEVNNGDFVVDGSSEEMLRQYLLVLSNPDSTEPLPAVVGRG